MTLRLTDITKKSDFPEGNRFFSFLHYLMPTI